MTFAEYSAINAKRCQADSPEGFGESLTDNINFGPMHWALTAGEEMGEVIGAVLGAMGKKARKKHLTKQDVFDEIGDVVACLDLLAQSLGSNIGECARGKFNKVSERLGSRYKL